MIRRLSVCVLFLALMICGQTTYGQGSRAIALQNGWARKTGADNSTINIYFEITNASSTPDELTSIWTPDAETAHLMKPHWSGLKMSMETVSSLRLGPGQKIQLKPGSYQITLSRVTREVHPGQPIALELHFRNAGRVEYSVTVSNKLIVSGKSKSKDIEY